MTSPSIWCSQSTPELRNSSNSSNDQVPGILSTHPTTTRDVQSCPLHRLCLLFSHRTALFRFNGTPWIFLTTLCLVIRFSCQLIFNKLLDLYTESVERKPLPALTKLLHGLHGMSFEKVAAVIWRSEKEKKVEEWTGSKLRSWSWSFVPAATCACLQPLTKHWSIYAKAATIVSPV